MTTAFRAFPPVLILLALAVMLLPTWRTRWLGPSIDSVNSVDYRWFAPIVLGYGNPFPLLCLGSTVLALILALARLAGGRRGIVLEVVLGVAIVAAACGAVIFDGLHGWGLAAPALLLLCLLVLLYSRLVARVARGHAETSQPELSPPGSAREAVSPGTDQGPIRGS